MRITREGENASLNENLLITCEPVSHRFADSRQQVAAAMRIRQRGTSAGEQTRRMSNLQGCQESRLDAPDRFSDSSRPISNKFMNWSVRPAAAAKRLKHSTWTRVRGVLMTLHSYNSARLRRRWSAFLNLASAVAPRPKAARRSVRAVTVGAGYEDRTAVPASGHGSDPRAGARAPNQSALGAGTTGRRNDE